MVDWENDYERLWDFLQEINNNNNNENNAILIGDWNGKIATAQSLPGEVMLYNHLLNRCRNSKDDIINNKRGKAMRFV